MSIDVANLLSSSSIRKSEVEYLVQAESSKEFSSFLDKILERVDQEAYNWIPVGQQVNNQMIADITDNMTGLVENLTNISDAYLLKNYDEGNYKSSHEAAEHLIEDQDVAKMRFDGGIGEKNPSVTFSDRAHGQSREDFDVFVSPYESGVTKQKYDFLQGRRGVGGMTALSHTKNGDKFVASASDDNPKSWTWTVIRQMKDGDYYYLKLNGDFPTFNGVFDCGNGIGEKTKGTVIKLYSYSLKTNPKTATNNAFRRRLSRYLPNPVSPVEIVDTRRDSINSYTYTGLRNEIENASDAFYDQISGTVDIFNIGEVRISVFIKRSREKLENMESSGEIPEGSSKNYTNVLTTQNEPRMIISVNGQAHARYTKSNMKSETGFREVGENMIILVEFDDNTLEANNNVFNTGRDGFSDKGVENQFINAVTNFVSSSDEINKISRDFQEQEDRNNISISGINPTFSENLKCSSGEQKELEIGIDSNADTMSSKNCIESSLDILVGQVQSMSTEFDSDGNINLNITPEFQNNSKIVCKLTVSDSDDSYTHTFVLQKDSSSKERQQRKTKTEESEKEFSNDSPIVSMLNYSSQIEEYVGNKSRNNAHTMGQEFEDIVEQWIKDSGQKISSKGGKNHPPDQLLKEGPALEIKKVTSTGQIPTNSSPPEQEITPDNPRLKEDTKEVLRNSENPRRDMFYIIGDKRNEDIERIWICQGELLFGNHELDNITQELRNAADKVSEDFNVESVEDTNEIAKFNNIDDSDSISLRIRRMMSFNHPSNIFDKNVPSMSESESTSVILSIKKDKFNSLTEADKSSLKENDRINIQEVRLKNSVAKVIVIE